VVDSSKGASEHAAPDTQFETLEAEHALFDGRVQGLVTVITPTERPLQGLAGLLDWRFQGAISRFLETGFLTGRTGEFAYLPIERGGSVYHLLLVGADTRSAISQDAVKTLKKNLSTLKLSRLGISRDDWNGAPDEFFTKNLKGTGVCLLR
jgi:hypothetical protein